MGSTRRHTHKYLYIIYRTRRFCIQQYVIGIKGIKRRTITFLHELSSALSSRSRLVKQETTRGPRCEGRARRGGAHNSQAAGRRDHSWYLRERNLDALSALCLFLQIDKTIGTGWQTGCFSLTDEFHPVYGILCSCVSLKQLSFVVRNND